MAKYLAGRALAMGLTLFVILTLAFGVVRLMPGSVYEDPNLPATLREALEAQLYLDRPLAVQYARFLKGAVLEGDWGMSLIIEPGVPAFQVLRGRIPLSLGMNLAALLVALPVGGLAGLTAALGRGKGRSRAVSLGVVACISVPSFVVAALLQYWVAFRWGLAPIVYRPGAVGSLVLPVLALAALPAATVARYLRGELAGLMGADFMLLARAKGLKSRQALLRHGLRNAGVTMVTIIAPMLANVLGGSLVIERIFAIPGVGGIMIDAINARDHWLTVAALFFYSAVSLATLLLADLAYGLVDPRIRMGARS